MDVLALKIMQEKLKEVEKLDFEVGSVEHANRQCKIDLLHELLRTYAVRSGGSEEPLKDDRRKQEQLV